MHGKGGLAIDTQDCPNLTISLIGGIYALTTFVNTGKFISVTTMMQKETSEDCTYILELEGDLFQQ